MSITVCSVCFLILTFVAVTYSVRSCAPCTASNGNIRTKMPNSFIIERTGNDPPEKEELC